ncbi:hypothetical protein [Streptomyces rapamycinicus]|uniref:Uncharacterized protein n=2 Tax=Streptomyces rapamycinicus TaxID=1226757 RepID=A0A0A0NCE8_STRRN|nr:hypothetical protein [Streptomyces rapamycinicus]AGP53773.1 hypothetical protein M271_10860 [Streptomyces rapamycinicus NRRL 5491]MBB4781262.1 hypothetical protein [Streptomyces rapamycinicus]RLV74094.1 hypothetical protein D3C57_132750 [Streptomyces rapamycinicus NRRL 5491]UTO61894.1 hypothetical protein LJB45_05900 [Streptomyces rapamycinicus]UTP29846.1 hypothetical protein LIV37_11015 [Streptomyces rapamycinicus NRRL 5491]
MSQAQPTPEPAPDAAALPPFDLPYPCLVAGMDSDEATLTFGLGLVARKAAELEYVLHGLVANMAGVELAYTCSPAATGGQLCNQGIDSLNKAGDDHPVPTSARGPLMRDLERCRELMDDRNRYLHGYWIFDHAERQQWLTLKGKRGSNKPEIAFTYSSAPWQLAHQLEECQQCILYWDMELFGQPGDPEEGQPEQISVKRIR